MRNPKKKGDKRESLSKDLIVRDDYEISKIKNRNFSL